MRIMNITKNTLLADSCSTAGSFFKRFAGLMGKKSLSPGSGLILTPCNSIHMFFMRFPIDAVFIDKCNTVVRTVENLKPWRVSPPVKGARSVIELPAGAVRKSGTEAGDMLAITE